MSNNLDRTPQPPKTERWVILMVLAFVPVIAALFMPQATRMPLVVVSGVLFVVAFAMMIRQSRESRDSDSLRRLIHRDDPE